MSFQLAELEGARIPRTRELSVAEGEAFHPGALLVENEYGEWAEVVADDYDAVSDVQGLALARYGIDGTVPYSGSPSMDILGGLGFPPGKMQALVVERGNRNKRYSAEYVGSLPGVTGGSYGVIRSADGEWRVNFADTTNEMVRLESIVWAQAPLNKNRVIVTFNPAPEVVS